jgi:transposase
MRGEDTRSGSLFSYVDVEGRVPRKHPLRAIREIVNQALAELSREFEALYSHTGRPGIAPEKLLRALLLQAFYSIRSERRLMQELEFNLLYRWFVGLGIDDAVWDATVFCKNRDRLLAGEVAARFLTALLAQPRVKRLLSGEHFSVDGTLIEAWASIKSLRPMADAADGAGTDGPGDGGPSDTAARAMPEGRNAERDFHGARWSNDTHRSSTDGDARLYRKGRGKEARLCYLGHALMENRHGLVVDGLVSRATGEAERLAAEAMVLLRPGRRRITIGADKAYDAAEFVATCKAARATPHIARNQSGRSSNIDDALAASEGYVASQRARKRIEEVFAWVKTIAGWRKTRHRGLARVGWQFTLALAAYNLIRLPKLLAAPAPAP